MDGHLFGSDIPDNRHTRMIGWRKPILVIVIDGITANSATTAILQQTTGQLKRGIGILAHFFLYDLFRSHGWLAGFELLGILRCGLLIRGAAGKRQ